MKASVMPKKACPSCSAFVETEKDFCPECGTPYARTVSSATSSATSGPSQGGGSVGVSSLAAAALGCFFVSSIASPLPILDRILPFTWWDYVDGWAKVSILLDGPLLLLLLVALLVVSIRSSSEEG